MIELGKLSISFFCEFLAHLEAFLRKKWLNVKKENSRLYQTKVDNRYRCAKGRNSNRKKYLIVHCQMASVKCKIHLKNKTVPRTLKSSDWNARYKNLIEYVELKVKGTHLQHFHILVEETPIDSLATFKQAIMNRMQQKEIHVHLKVCTLCFCELCDVGMVCCLTF